MLRRTLGLFLMFSLLFTEIHSRESETGDECERELGTRLPARPRLSGGREIENRKEFSNAGQTGYVQAYNAGVIHSSDWREAAFLHAQAVAPDLEPGAVVIDAGGGTGRMTQKLRGERPDLDVRLMDVNPDMLAYASSENGVPEAQIHVSGVTAMHFGGHAPGEGVPVADGSVDHVFSHSVIWVLDDPEEFFIESARVLRSGGRLAVSSGLPRFRDDELRAEFVDEVEKDMNRAFILGQTTEGVRDTMISANRALTGEMNSLMETSAAIAMAERHGFRLLWEETIYSGMFFFLVFEKR